MKKIFVFVTPLIVGIFPVLFFFNHNIFEISATATLYLILIIIVGAFLVTLGLGFLLKNFEKSALIVSLFLFFFLSFGHIKNLFLLVSFFRLKANIVNLVYLVLLLIVVGVIVFLIIRSKKILRPYISIVFLIASVMVMFQLGQIGLNVLNDPKARYLLLYDNQRIENQSGLPDIYYLVLDGYARTDILKELYNTDNSDFLNFLREKGFYVAEKSYSNYCQTLLSLSSMLNMNYLSDLISINEKSRNRAPLFKLLKKNRFFKILKKLNYSIVTISSGYKYTELKNVDKYIQPKGALSEFWNVFISTTALSLLFDWKDSLHYKHRKRILHTYETLANVENLSGPMFVMSHMISPHPPFIFDENGNHIEPNNSFGFVDANGFIKNNAHEEYWSGYRKQLTYITSLLKQTIQKILDRYKTNPPIIIIQSDHGPGLEFHFSNLAKSKLEERFSVLSAYYFPSINPNSTRKMINYDLSPVNIFRYLCNTYFGMNYEMLTHFSYFTSWRHPYKYIDITNKLKYK